MRKLDLIPLYPNKMSWDFSKKKECDNIIKEWCYEFKILNLKGKNFLRLLNNNFLDIKPFYTKGGSWIKNFRFSNSLYTQATQDITNHAPIGEYWLCFFPREEFSCLCRLYSIETRCYIFYNCRRFNKEWNLGRETLFQFKSFLEFNPNELVILLWL